jgi:hypothetical protein
MADALTTLKLLPSEFALIVEALNNDADDNRRISKDPGVEAPVRRAASEREAQQRLLLTHLQR